MKTILCATDFSPSADQAAAAAAALAAAVGARLELLHVVHVPAGVPAEMISEQLMDALTDSARFQLDRRVRDLAPRAGATAALRTGVIDQAIVARATEVAADLVVLGTHGHRRAMRLFVGSVAERIVRASPAPVLVVPPLQESTLAAWTPAQRPLRVVAGVDTSPASDGALRWLRALRGQVACDLRLVHLYRAPREHERLGLDAPDPFEPDAEVVDVLSRELAAHLSAHLGTADVRLRVRPIWGGDDDALAWEAETDDADLLVVGTSQSGHGSMAIATLRSARQPVLCVPAQRAVVQRARAPEPLRSVVVTTDFSSLANAAIPHAYRLLLRSRGTVTLLHVAEPGQFGLSPERRSEIETCLLALVPRGVDAHAIHTRVMVVEAAAPAPAILKAARRVGADALVMSSHGRSGLGRALRGSVTEALLHQAALPVLVVPAPERAQA